MYRGLSSDLTAKQHSMLLYACSINKARVMTSDIENMINAAIAILVFNSLISATFLMRSKQPLGMCHFQLTVYV